MAEVPAVDDTLKPEDAVKILEELLDAQNHAHLLGLMMNVKPRDVEAIQATYQQPKDRLLHIILAFLNQAEPRPTWRVIVDALKSPVVNLETLAMRVEAAHFPTSTRDVVPEPVDTESAANTTAADDEESSPSPQLPSPASATDSLAVAELQGEIKSFHQRFNSIKRSTIKCLEQCRITVVEVVYFLTSILALGDHKRFFEKKTEYLYQSTSHFVLFGKLNLYWNPLSYGLLKGLVEELAVEDSVFETVSRDMTEYNEDMEIFRETTTLALFCEVAPDMLGLQTDDPPPEFRKMVTKHRWPDTVTLKDVEQFRKYFSRKFGLPECAMMVNRIRRGSFTITWFLVIPPNVFLALNYKEFKDFKVISVVIDDASVYQPPFQVPARVSSLVTATESISLGEGATAYLTSSKKKQVRHTKSMPTLQSWIGDRELTVTQQQLRQQAKPRTRAESLTPWKRVWQHPRSHLPATAVPRLTVPDMWQQRRKEEELQFSERTTEIVGRFTRVERDLAEIQQQLRQIRFSRSTWQQQLGQEEEELQFERVNETVRLFERELAKINHQIIQITFHTSTWQQLIQLAKPRKGTESLTPWKGVWPHPRPHLKVGSLATAVPRRTVSTTWQQRQKEEELQFSERTTEIVGSFTRVERELAEIQQQLRQITFYRSTWQQQLGQEEEELQFSERVRETVRLFERQLDKIHLQLREITYHTSTWQQQLRQEEKEILSTEKQAVRQRLTTEFAKTQQKLTLKEMELKYGEIVKETAKQQLTRKETELAETQQQLKQKEKELQSGERENEAVKQQLTTKETEVAETQQQQKQKCHDKKTAPCEMFRGSAATHSRFAYFTPQGSTSLYQYEYDTDKWEGELPSCPYRNSGLVVIDRELTAVGGEDGSYTNKLYTLQQREWVEKYPPMNTARSSPAVVIAPDGEYVIVIGGNDGCWTATVELFQVKSRIWHKLTDLRKPLPYPSAAICGDRVHVIGWGDEGYSCSLKPSDKQIPTQLLRWLYLPPLPVTESTAAALRGQLVLIGGRKSGYGGGQYGSPVNSIHQLWDEGGKWVKIGSMASGRTYSLVVSPSPDKIIIVGGWGAQYSVEEFGK